MIHTFRQLQNEVLRVLDEAGVATSENSTTRSLSKDFINQAHQLRCTEFPWSFMLWPRNETITTVGGQHQYALHPEFHRPYYFYHTSARRYLRELPFRVTPDHTPNDCPTGSAEHFWYWGILLSVCYIREGNLPRQMQGLSGWF